MRNNSRALALSIVIAFAGMTLKAETVAIEPPLRKVVAPELVVPIVPDEELPVAASSNAGVSIASAFAAHRATVPQITPDSSALTGPVTLNYSGASPALEVGAAGTGKGVQAIINNTKNSSSAIYGLTNGTAAGLTGYNNGTGGPAGKIIILNDKSQQPALFASTNGFGSAITATITNTQNNGYPAVLAQNAGAMGIVGDGASVGIQGNSTGGSGYGVAGYSLAKGSTINLGSGYGVYGASGSGSGIMGTNQVCCGAGVYGSSDKNGYGVFGYSVSGIGVAAGSSSGSALIVATGGAFFTSYEGEAIDVQSTTTPGIIVNTTGNDAIYATSGEGIGIFGGSTNSYGIYGSDSGTGVGIYGTSAKGLAGSFAGNVNISGTLTVGSTTYTSDKNLKADVRAIDPEDLLARVSSLPISSWDYKSDATRRHIGPMAQDFHAAFGLNGADETHINEVDIAGVSLAAIQELHRQMQQKDARIEKLEAQLVEQAANVERSNEQTAAFAKRLAALESKLGSNRDHDIR